MKITFRQLSIFQVVAQCRSITRAAEQLHLSQPAVSMQIKKLEEAVGLDLTYLVGKQIHLTEAGEEMLRYCQRIGKTLAEAEAVFAGLKGVRHGRLSIAVASTVNYFATKLIAQYHKQYPDIQIRLEVTNRVRLLEQLEGYEKDIILMGRPPDSPDLVHQPFMDNPLVVIAAPEHPLAGRRRISLETIQREPFVLRELGSGTRVALEGFFREKGIDLGTRTEMSSNEAIKQAVMAGLGLGVVSAHTVELELSAGALVILDVAHFPIRRQWYVVHRRDKPLSHAAEEFKRFLIAHASETAAA